MHFIYLCLCVYILEANRVPCVHAKAEIDPKHLCCLLTTLFFGDRVLQRRDVSSIRLNWPAHEPQGSACLHFPVPWLWTCATAPRFLCGCWGDLSVHVCMPITLPTKPSPQPCATFVKAILILQ